MQPKRTRIFYLANGIIALACALAMVLIWRQWDGGIFFMLLAIYCELSRVTERIL